MSMTPPPYRPAVAQTPAAPPPVSKSAGQHHAVLNPTAANLANKFSLAADDEPPGTP